MTSIESYGTIDKDAKEVYGSGPVVLRIGNGGAGATGLLQALAEDYLSVYYQSQPASITWVCNHSRNTQLAMLDGYIDIALTYELSQAEMAEQEGWSKTVGPAFHDHFVIAGPVADPAGLKNIADPAKAFQKIAQLGVPFLSRADNSATMWKERFFWDVAGICPWEEKHDWYEMTQYSPTEAVIVADEKGSYLLIDRSTLLCQTAQGKVKQMTVFFEPEASDDVLMNTCYTLHGIHPGSEVQRFVEFLESERAQDLVARFGENEAGLPLFANISDQFARTRLKGGRPDERKWVTV